MDSARTSSGAATPGGGALTVRAALDLPILRGGAPEVVVGSDNLDIPLRWVHVFEVRDIASVLRGGELLLSEGRMFGSAVEDRRLIAELTERGVAALVIELGPRHRTLPKNVVAACREHGLTLIALHLPVAFIDITEAIHSQIVSYKLGLLDSAHQLQDRLTQLALANGRIPEILDILAEAVQNPVIYERQYGGFVYQALHTLTERDVAAAWEQFTRRIGTAPDALETVLAIRERSAGRIVALSLNRPFTEADEVALERTAGIISLVLMRDEHQDSVAARNQRGFLTALMHGEMPPYRAESRAATLGFTAPVLLPLAIRAAAHHRSRPLSLEDRLWKQIWDDVNAEMKGRRVSAMIDQAPSNDISLVMLGLEDVTQRRAAVDRFAAVVQEAADRHIGMPNGAIICAGSAVHTWQAAGEGLILSVEAMEGSMQSQPRAWHDAVDLDLDRLLWSLRQNPDLARFAHLRLDTLLDHDRQRRSELFKTLQVLLRLNGRKAEAARALHLERQSLYSRVERIESLLEVDLDDPDTRLGLHLALRIMRQLPEAVDDFWD
ncbi:MULTISPECIES: PucR family transcriptional regulator [Nocardiaceae]|uniref:Purine catabolism regulator n=1 Tax=Rhodococcoides corynebacterioides TaxID=53972 RepID=A0ABS2KZL7_9NOCA|nr:MULTISPECIES: PucR family transcriptional regulator [Rhodococcus]MBM7417385.1 purine catabolism regulator [Rhodococcus corynebacterioides]MBP1115639.1 purine catabolism regulator [Rhodococcus sp. PvP016]